MIDCAASISRSRRRIVDQCFETEERGRLLPMIENLGGGGARGFVQRAIHFWSTFLREKLIGSPVLHATSIAS
jgi:hypothetical protein